MGYNNAIGYVRRGGGSGPIPPEDDMRNTIDVIFSGEGNWNAPESGNVVVDGWGGGGGGQDGLGGGGGGEYQRLTGFAVVAGDSYAYDVGAGGIGGVASADGQPTSWNGGSLIANPGRGRVSGGAGGTGGTGTVGYDGAAGITGAGGQNGGAAGGDAGAAPAGTTTMGGGRNGGSSFNGGIGSTVVGGGSGVGGSSGTFNSCPGTAGEIRVIRSRELLEDYPNLVGRAWGRDSLDQPSRPAVLPNNARAGDLVLLWVGNSGGVVANTPEGWTEIGVGFSNPIRGQLFARISPDDGGATITLPISRSLSQMSWVIRNAGMPTATFATGSSTNANAPNHAPAGGNAPYLWLALCAWDGASNNSRVTVFPDDTESHIYLPRQRHPGSGLAVMASCERYLEAASWDPTAWTSQTEQWVTATVSIPRA